ncbi:MAG: hypothetical protein AAF998_01815 [Bacteroidota bacterium]
MNQTVIFWVFITIFGITAVITLLGITNVIKVKYLKWFVTGLILEVIALVITWAGAGTLDYSAEINQLWQTTFPDSTRQQPENEIRSLTLINEEITRLQSNDAPSTESLNRELTQAKATITRLEQELASGRKDSPRSRTNGFSKYMDNFTAIYGIFNRTGWETINLAYNVRKKMDLGLYPAVMNILEGFDLDVGDPAELSSINDTVNYCQRGLARFLRRNGVVRDSTDVIEPIGEKNVHKIRTVLLTKWMLGSIINYYVATYLGNGSRR